METVLSDEIRRCREGPVHNPYQGSDKRILFVCSMGLLRSPTAARLYSSKYNTRSCGVWPDALIPITPVLLEWAAEIVFVHPRVFDEFMSTNLSENLPFLEKSGTKVVILEIPDRYPHMSPELIAEFKERYERID